MANPSGREYKRAMDDDKTQTQPQPSGSVTAEETVVRSRPPAALDLEMFRARLGIGQRLIGIDVGSKTLGLALSDVTRTIATGLETIRRTKFQVDATRLIDIATQHRVGGLVIGLPINMDGSFGPRVQSTRAFQRSLSALTDLPMLFWDERLSSAAAERILIEGDASRRRRAEVIDKMAATIILQTALNRLRTPNLD
jgi:putative holliday junction resolvase